MLQRYAFFLSSFALLTTATLAQQIVTLRNGSNVVNGQTLAIVGEPTTFELGSSLSVTLNSNSERTLKVKRYEMTPVAGTSNTFCWGECYLPYNAGERPVWISDLSETLQPGVEFEGFHGYYYPTGTAAMSTFRFVWYPIDDPTDTAYVDIVFDTRENAVGVNELSNAPAGVEVFPNPVAGPNMGLRFTGEAAKTGGRWVLYNTLGGIEREGSLRSGQGDVQVDVNGLGAGIYFASLMRNGRVQATRRVVIAR